MASFPLKVVTPARVIFDGEAERVIVRTVSGDIGILKGHAPYVAPLAIGRLEIAEGESVRLAAIAGGMIRVEPNSVTVLTSTCEWVDEIDIERAKKALERAQDYIKNPTQLHTEEVAKVKLERALNRIRLAERK